MREIIFRGKSAEDGKWFTGQLLHFKSPVSKKELNVVVEGCEWDDSNEWFNIGRRAKVVPETVGQYTGLTDKNGKKIFEGDIVRLCRYALEWEDKSNWKFEIGYIRFKNGCFIIEDIYSSDGYNELSCVYDAITCGGEYDSCVIFEVIGNKWDNPELLKGGEK